MLCADCVHEATSGGAPHSSGSIVHAWIEAGPGVCCGWCEAGGDGFGAGRHEPVVVCGRRGRVAVTVSVAPVVSGGEVVELIELEVMPRARPPAADACPTPILERLQVEEGRVGGTGLEMLTERTGP